jgi:Fur family transcriptional regulator, ferric uptake regulator
MTTLENLKNTGLKVTAQRLKILDIFNTTSQRHLSADDVYRLLILDKSDIGLATVYRVLAQFEQAGILSRNQFDGGKVHYELNEGEHHDHLLCLDCGRVEEFFDNQIEQRQCEIAQQKGFTITDHALSIYARCNRKNCIHRPDNKTVN